MFNLCHCLTVVSEDNRIASNHFFFISSSLIKSVLHKSCQSSLRGWAISTYSGYSEVMYHQAVSSCLSLISQCKCNRDSSFCNLAWVVTEVLKTVQGVKWFLSAVLNHTALKILFVELLRKFSGICTKTTTLSRTALINFCVKIVTGTV